MSYEPRIREIERRLEMMDAELRRVQGLATALDQQLPRAFQSSGGGLGGGSTMLIRLTANGSSYLHEWEEVYWTGSSYSTTGVVGTSAAGDRAREVTGLLCPASDEVIPAWRDLSGALTFKAVRYFGKADADIAAGGSGTVSVWAVVSGTVQDTSLNVTAYNFDDVNQVTSGKRNMLTPHAGKWWVDYETC